MVTEAEQAGKKKLLGGAVDIARRDRILAGLPFWASERFRCAFGNEGFAG